MSSGLPVVLTPAPAFKALVIDGVNGILTPVGDSKKLAQSIEQAYLRRDVLIPAARRTILERYSRAWYLDCFERKVLWKALPDRPAALIKT